LIGLGWTGLALVVVDRYLQYVDRQDAGYHVAVIEREQRRARQKLLEEWRDSPALFVCTARQEYKGMGGTHGLKNVRLGDRIDILQERVGPGGHYNLCRLRRARPGEDGADVSVGWYPIAFLEKEMPKSKLRRWIGW